MRSRLEDQRGTEINFELPDFLKDKENEQKNVMCRKIRRTEDNNNTDRRALVIEKTQNEWMQMNAAATAKNIKLEMQPNYENRNIMTCNNKMGLYINFC